MDGKAREIDYIYERLTWTQLSIQPCEPQVRKVDPSIFGE